MQGYSGDQRPHRDENKDHGDHADHDPAPSRRRALLRLPRLAGRILRWAPSEPGSMCLTAGWVALGWVALGWLAPGWRVDGGLGLDRHGALRLSRTLGVSRVVRLSRVVRGGGMAGSGQAIRLSRVAGLSPAVRPGRVLALAGQPVDRHAWHIAVCRAG